MSAVAVVSWRNVDTALRSFPRVAAAQPERTQRWYVPELLRIKGEVLLGQGSDRRITEAEGCFGHARDMAREHGALFRELRIAPSFARSRAAEKRHDGAKQILSPVYDRFTEGLGTADLRAAKAAPVDHLYDTLRFRRVHGKIQYAPHRSVGMPCWHARAVAITFLALAATAAAQPAGGVRRFDGTWEATVVCSDWHGALGYSKIFPVMVSDGHLQGQYEKKDQPNSLTLEGTIQPDGRATISANGVTGPSKFNIAQIQQGEPYNYSITAQFERAHGHGKRMELRPCDVDFVRQ